MSNFSDEQVLNQVLDRTDPDNPALRTTGGGGGGGNVAVTSIAAGDNNIGNVDIVSHPAGSLAGLTAVTQDFDTGAGTVNLLMVGLAKSASGGPVELGTGTNPIRTDPTGTTTQPVSHPAGSLAGVTAVTSDYDSGAGTATTPMMGIALPGSGGPVQGGTSTNPLRTDPVGTTAQPVKGQAISGGGAQTILSVSTSSASKLSADSTRDYVEFHNTGSVDVYMNHGAAATVADGIYLPAGALRTYSGGMAARAWHMITSSGTGSVRCATGTV